MQRQAAKIAEKEKIQALYFSAERKNVLVKVKENGEARGSRLSFRMKRKVGQRRGKTGGIANILTKKRQCFTIGKKDGMILKDPE